MADFMKSTPQIAVVLASLLLWVSFAWGLPAETPPAEGEGGPLPQEDLWGWTTWLYAGIGFGLNSSLNVGYEKYRGSLCVTLNKYSTMDVGLLFGYCPHPRLAIAGGVSWTRVGRFLEDPPSTSWDWGVGSPKGHVENSYTVGLPFEVQWTPFRGSAVGLGLAGHLNLNKEEIFGGATIGIQLGKLI